jgi:F-type H+-transporting ATPase subunit delta
LVARRYATALLEIGAESGDLDNLVVQVEQVAAAWVESRELQNAIENPLVPHHAKKAVVTQVLSRLGVGPVVKSTVQLLVDRRRMRTLAFIARDLREMSDARRGVVRAEVVSAVQLSEAYYAKLQARLEQMTGKKVVVDKRQDPGLIAGVVTRIGDRIFDGSLRTRLQTMRDALMPQS